MISTNSEEISYVEAILAAQTKILSDNEKSLVIGINVASPSAIFGSVRGLSQAFGSQRIIESPASENAMTGIALGLATSGHVPILVHQRMDFAILSFDMLINQVAKWKYMYGDKLTAPIIIRMIVGRGWGQGPQHSQSLHNVFMHVPGFSLYMPSSPQDIYSGLLEASKMDSPSIFFEHRWLYESVGEVDKRRVSLENRTRTLSFSESSVLTVITISFSTLETLRAKKILDERDVFIDIFEVVRLDDLDLDSVLESINRTGKLLIVDIGHVFAGAASSILSELTIRGAYFSVAPKILGLPNYPTPTAPSLTKSYYPKCVDILFAVKQILSLPFRFSDPDDGCQLDVPGNRFIGYY